jgi:O-antigen/teichoic acid export membrane protein
MPLSPRNLLRLKDEFALTAATGLALIIQFVFQSVVVRMVSPEQFGLISSLLAIQGVLNIPIAIWQLAQARSLSSFSGSGREFRRFAFSQLWQIRHVAIAGILLYLLLGPLVRVYIQETTSHVWLLVVLGCLLSVIESWGLACFQSLHKFLWLGLVSVGAALARLGAILLLIPQLSGVAAVLTAVLGGFLVPIVAILILLKGLRGDSITGQAQFLELSFVPASLTTAFTVLWLNMDFIIARSRFSPVMAGEYATVAVLCKAVFWFASPIATIYLPRFVKALNHSAGDAMSLLRKAVILSVVVGAFAMAVAWPLSHWLISIFAGRHENGEMADWLRLALAAKLPVVCTLPLLAYFVAKDSKRVLVLLLTILILTILYAQAFAEDVHMLLAITFLGGLMLIIVALVSTRLTASSHDIRFSWERRPVRTPSRKESS